MRDTRRTTNETGAHGFHRQDVFERYGDDMANLVTNVTNMFTTIPASSVKPPEPPPTPGLRIVGDED